MRKNQSIMRTTFPDGSTVRWLNNSMPKPITKDMSDFIKSALLRKINGNKFKPDFDQNYGEKLLKEANQLIIR